MSINKLISIRNPIVDAMDLVGADHDKNIPFFTRNAILAEKEIGSSYGYAPPKRKVLTITGCTANIPEDAEYLDIAIMGDQGCDCGDLRTIYTGHNANTPSTFGTIDNTFLVVDVNSTVGGACNYPNFSIQNNKLIFEQNLDGEKITVQYLAAQTDCDGFVEISQNHVNAIKWFIVYMYFFRKFGINNYESMKMKEAKFEWQRECSHARAQDAELTSSQRANLVGMYHNPYAGISLNYGMRTILRGRLNW